MNQFMGVFLVKKMLQYAERTSESFTRDSSGSAGVNLQAGWACGELSDFTPSIL